MLMGAVNKWPSIPICAFHRYCAWCCAAVDRRSHVSKQKPPTALSMHNLGALPGCVTVSDWLPVAVAAYRHGRFVVDWCCIQAMPARGGRGHTTEPDVYAVWACLYPSSHPTTPVCGDAVLDRNICKCDRRRSRATNSGEAVFALGHVVVP